MVPSVRIASRHWVRASIAHSGGRRQLKAVSLVTGALLLAACSFEYTDVGASPENLLEHLPETEFTGVTHTIVRNGRVVREIRAKHVRNFRRGGRTELEDVNYTEYDGAGNAVTIGSVVHAVYYTQREDAELAGAIRLRSESEGVRLEAESLRWVNKHRRLIGDRDEMVEIARDDGSRVSGAGLEVDARTKTVRFSRLVSGSLVIESAGATTNDTD